MPTRWDVTRAVRSSDLPAPSRLVMLVLADVAEVGTAEIPEQFTPSLSVLAKETGLGEATVKRHLTLLERDGWVVRRRPSPDAARLNGERTRYQLTLPGHLSSSDHGSDRAMEGSERAHPRLTVSPALGSERAHPGLSVSPNKKELRSSSDQDRSVASPPAEPTFAEASSDENAGQILKAFIDYCTEQGVQLPKRLIGQYAKEIKNALDDGGKFTPKMIKKALAGMVRDNVVNHPSYLSSRLVAIQTGPERWPRGATNEPYRNPANQDDYDEWKARR